MAHYDVAVIGGGIAGASIAAELAHDRSVGLFETEPTLAHHTTGRSAAMFLESYGGPTVRRVTAASRTFLENPPEGFGRPLLTPLPLVWVAGHDRVEQLTALHRSLSAEAPQLQLLDVDETVAATVIMRREWVGAGLVEPDACAIDVAALHGGYVGWLRRHGGAVHTAAGVASLRRERDGWQVLDHAGGTHTASIVVDAAGAWADVVADMAGVRPVGIQPMRRTIFTVAAPTTVDSAPVPLVADIADGFYVKQEGPHLLCSPADEVPSVPCDARPEEIDIARAIDVINEATTLDIRHVRSSWAGLRNFVADRSPVVGFDDAVPGFFWFVGQGGYGIQMAPALAATGASLIRSGTVPAALADVGLTADDLHRRRLDGLTEMAAH